MANPVEQFVIKEVFKDSQFNFNGIDLTYTNSALWMTIAVILSATFLSIAMRKKEMVPGRMQMFAEQLDRW